MSTQPKNGETTTQNSNGKLPDVCENHKKSCFKKTRIKQTFLRLEEEKYSPFFCLTLWKKTNPHHHHHYYHHHDPPNSSFFHLFFVPILKKEKQIWKQEIWSYFLRLLLFRTHTNTEIVLPRNKSKNSPRQQKIFSIAFSTTSLLLWL